jgi:hypothetical protein
MKKAVECVLLSVDVVYGCSAVKELERWFGDPQLSTPIEATPPTDTWSSVVWGIVVLSLIAVLYRASRRM